MRVLLTTLLALGLTTTVFAAEDGRKLVEEMNAAIESRNALKPPDPWEALNERAVRLFQEGCYDGAVVAGREAIGAAESLYGPEDYRRRRSLTNMGMALYQCNRYDDAIETLSLARSLLPERARTAEVGEMSLSLGLSYNMLGEWAKGQGACLEAVESFRRNPPRIRLEQPSALVCLGESLVELGQGSEATPYLLDAVTMSSYGGEGDEGLGDVLLMSATRLLGRAHMAEGEVAEAGSFYQVLVDALTAGVRVRSAWHVALTLRDLAKFHLYTGQRRLAISEVEDAVRILRDSLGSDHPGLVHVLLGAGLVYREVGSLEKSEEVLKEAEAAARKHKSLLAPVWIKTAFTLIEKGNSAAALDASQLARRALEASGDNELDELFALIAVATSALGAGELEAADEASDRAVDILRRSGRYRPAVPIAFTTRIRVLRAQGRDEEAEELELELRWRTPREIAAEPRL